MDNPRAAAFHLCIDDSRLLFHLRNGDEEAFISLVRRHHAAMVGVARRHVASDRVAEDVAQDAWVAMLHGLDRFEGRSTLKVWLFAIVANIAKDHGRRERRSYPFSAIGEDAVIPEQLATASPEADPERRLMDSETRAVLMAAIRALPRRQRIVITLRDVWGMSGPEVCALLHLSAGNQRLLLHRARQSVRGVLSGAPTSPARSRAGSRAP
jgi:RNA polymerase sigma-70 factor (ECF subfamily)